MRYRAEYQNERGESIVFSLKSEFIITKNPLLNGLPVKVSTSQSISQIGGSIESQLIEPNAVTISGIICGEAADAKQRLLHTIRPLEMGKMILNDRYCLTLAVTDTPAVESRRTFPRFEFGVKAPYPFWEDMRQNAVPMAGIAGTFRFPWKIAQPYQLGAAINSYFTNVYNAGQIPTGYTLEIIAAGSAVNPSCMDIQTGSFLRLNKVLQTGERVTIHIQPDRLTAVSSLDGDIEGLIDVESTLFLLRAGDNVIKYDAESGRENLNVQLKFTNKLAGVVV